MSKCDACNATILFGGEQWSRWTCCNADCVARLKRQLTEELVSPSDIEKQVEATFKARCALCQGDGPNDLFHSKKVTGMVFAVSWSTERHVCCAGCARKKKMHAFLHCLFLGWWAPKALVTNVLYYIPYNIVTAITASVPLHPSDKLTTVVKEIIAENNVGTFIRQIQANAAKPAT